MVKSRLYLWLQPYKMEKVHSIKLHIVLKVKKRKGILSGKVEECVVASVRRCCKEQGVVVEEVKCDLDHMHLLIELPVWIAPIVLIRNIMIVTEMAVWSEYETWIRRTFDGLRCLWSEDYFVASAHYEDYDRLREYIINQ